MLLEEMAHGTKLAERAEKVRRAAERCSRIVQTFLAMARQNRPERRIVHAAEIARAALDLTDYPLRTAGIRVTLEVTPDLPPLHADPDQLHQVLVNLVINAQHALQDVEGSRELVVRVQAAAEPGKLCIDVEDNGPGVPDEIRRRVFEPFFTTKPQGVGTGVGLSFSLGLVEAHGGRLELIDVPTGGTCFRITLDAATECAGAASVAVTHMRDDGEKHGSALIVDDEPELAEALAIFVGRAGYRVEVAANGLEAIRLLEADDYDIVLSDLRMPELDGPALHDWISRAKPHLLPRIGFITGDTLGQSAARFLGRTGCPVIEKPFTSAALRDLIELLEDERHAPVRTGSE
jgi:CheY-like chemotaxis protein